MKSSVLAEQSTIYVRTNSKTIIHNTILHGGCFQAIEPFRTA